MLSFPNPKGFHLVDDDDLPTRYDNIASENKNMLLLSYMNTNAKLPKGLLPYYSFVFLNAFRKGIAIICQILGYENDMMEDDTILGLMAFCYNNWNNIKVG